MKTRTCQPALKCQGRCPISFNGSGTFLSNSAGLPVVTATVISSTVFNALTADLATGLTNAICKDGQSACSARIPFANGINSTLATDATNTTTGSILTAGGVGIAKALWVGDLANIAGAVTLQSTLLVSSTAQILRLGLGAAADAAIPLYATRSGLAAQLYNSAAVSASGQAVLRLRALAAGTTAGSGPRLQFSETGDTLVGEIGTFIVDATHLGLTFRTYSSGIQESLQITGAGVVQPGSNNAQSLGTASLQWSDVRSVLGTFSSSLSAATLYVSADGGGAGGFTALTNVTNTTLTNAYVVKGGQAATTPNTGWVKIYIGANAAWVPYWQNATP